MLVRFLQRIRSLVFTIFLIFIAILGIVGLLIAHNDSEKLTVVISVVTLILALFGFIPWLLSKDQAHEEMKDLTERYDLLHRVQANPGEKEEVVRQMPALVSETYFSSKEIRTYLKSPHRGKRLAGLSILQELGKVEQGNIVQSLLK